MDILQQVQNNYDYMVSMRRHLHENPEVSNHEENTVKFIMEQLSANGIENEEIENGGVIGFINKGKPGPCILLRADCDALPTKESPNNLKGPKICVSKVEGAGHLCGHDAHTSTLIATGKILNEMRDQLDGSVVLLFERGEEGTGNIAYIFRYLQAHKAELPITTCYACHLKNNVPFGKVSVQEGPMLSGVGSFRVTLNGYGGHGSRPDLCSNPIDCFNAIYTGMNTIRSRFFSPFNPIAFSVCEVSSGSSVNVIPTDLFFQGTYRYFNLDDGKLFRDELLQLFKNEAALYNLGIDIQEVPRYLPVSNPKDLTGVLRRGVTRTLGAEVLTTSEPWMGSESFGSFFAQYPCAFSYVGIENEELGSGANHHTPEFDIDERAMVLASAAAIGYVLQFMEEKPDVSSFKPLFEDVEDLIEYCFWLQKYKR